MSSSQSQFPQPPQSASSSPKQPDTQATPPEPVPLAETSMDQHLVSTLMMDSSPASASSEETSTLDLTSEDLTDSEDTLSGSDLLIRQQPIPPASEPMQYRAIGLVKGKYTPLEEQFTRGMLLTEDGTTIDAVLLGRVMSLVKKHLDLEQSHLWVVYPRTRDKDNDLHVQIVGVWEPEKLNKALDGEASQSDDEENSSSEPGESDQASGEIAEDGYFSVRGEVLFYSPDDQRLIVKIQQSPRKGAEQGKSFKLNLKGTVEGKSVGYFWDFNVRRENNLLVVQDGTMIKMVPPKKHKAKKPARGGGRPIGKKRWDGPRDGGQRPQTGGDRSSVAAPPTRKAPLPKPVKKTKNESNPT